MSSFLLVDSAQTLDCVAKLFQGSWPDDLTLVASTSAGMVACERARVRYTALDRYSPVAEIISLGWNNYHALTNFCERWDEVAHVCTPSLKARGIKPFRFGYFDLKILVDSISIKLLMLRNFLRRAAGQEIFYVPEPDHTIVAGEFLRPRRDLNMFSVLLTRLLSGEARLTPLPMNQTRPKRTRLRSLPRAWLLSARSQVSAMRNTIRTSQMHRNRGNSRGRGYLCFDYGHDIRYVIPHLLRRQLRPLPIPRSTIGAGQEVMEECDALWQRFVTDKEFCGFFSCEGISYFPIVEKPLESYITSVLPRAIANYDHLRAAFARLDISFSLTCTINLGLVERCRMLAAQASGAPLITYHEGAGYGSMITPIYDFTEVLDGDAMLCYGMGNSEYYQDLGIATKPMIPVGSAHQDAVRKKLRKCPPPTRIRTAMYVGTSVDDNVNHCPNNGLVSTFYCATQIKIFRMLAALLASVRVIVKPHSGDIASRDLLQLAEFKRIRLETRRLEKVMQGVDLFILDFPSTTLLSCIATTAYVFVLVEQGVTGLTPKQRARLEKRAYIFENLDALTSAVREIVANTTRFAPRLDQSYLLAYGLYRPDGDVANHAADVLARIDAGVL